MSTQGPAHLQQVKCVCSRFSNTIALSAAIKLADAK
jgi:hypothetical protein